MEVEVEVDERVVAADDEDDEDVNSPRAGMCTLVDITGVWKIYTRRVCARQCILYLKFSRSTKSRLACRVRRARHARSAPLLQSCIRSTHVEVNHIA